MRKMKTISEQPQKNMRHLMIFFYLLLTFYETSL